MKVDKANFVQTLLPTGAENARTLMQKASSFAASSSLLKAHLASTALAIAAIAASLITAAIYAVNAVPHFTAKLLEVSFSAACMALAIDLLNTGRCLLFVALGTACAVAGIAFAKSVYPYITPKNVEQPNESTELQKRLKEAESKATELENQLTEANTKLAEAESKSVELESQLTETSAKLEAKQKTSQGIDLASESLHTLSEQLQKVTKQLSEARVEQVDAKAKSDQTLSDLQAKLSREIVEKKDLSDKRTFAESQLANIRAQKAQADQKLSDITDELNKVTKERNAIQGQFDVLKVDLPRLKIRAAGLETDKQIAELARNLAEQEVKEQRNKIAELEKRIKEDRNLRDLQEMYDAEVKRHAATKERESASKLALALAEQRVKDLDGIDETNSRLRQEHIDLQDVKEKCEKELKAKIELLEKRIKELSRA